MDATAITAFEWLAFGSVLVSTWLYGNLGTKGPLIGAASATMFVIYGVIAGIPAAWATNIAFIIIHMRNYMQMRAKT